MSIHRGLTVFALLLIPAFFLHSGEHESAVGSGERSEFSLEARGGAAIGQARELVFYQDGYDNYSKYLSELVWDLKPAVLFGLAAQLNTPEAGRYHLDIETALPIGTGSMEDFDWMYWNHNDYTHYSLHDIRLTGSVLLEIGGFWRIARSGGWDINLGAGYHLDYWSWEDALVRYQHSSFDTIQTYSGGDELIGDNPVVAGNGQDAIHYKVAYHIIYGAFQARYSKGRFTLDSTLSTGPVLAWAWDHHFGSPGTYYNDIGIGGPWTSLALDFALALGASSTLTLSAEFSWIFEFGGVTNQYNEYGAFEGTSDTAGFQYHLSKTMLGYRYTF